MPTVTAYRRRSAAVDSLHSQEPHIIFGPRRQTHSESTAHPETPKPSHKPRLCSWVTNNGYSARHAFDPAPFSHGMIVYTISAFLPMKNNVGSSIGNLSWPDIIETSHPPSLVPLTMACVAAIFISGGSDWPRLTRRQPPSEAPVLLNRLLGLPESLQDLTRRF